MQQTMVLDEEAPETLTKQLDEKHRYVLFFDTSTDNHLVMRWRYQVIADHVFDPIKKERDTDKNMRI